MAAWGEGDGVNVADFEGCVCNNDVERVRSCLGDAEGPKSGREAMEKGWGRIWGERVDEIEVRGGYCC